MTHSTEPSGRLVHTTSETSTPFWFVDSLAEVLTPDPAPGQPIVIEMTVPPGCGAPTHVHADLDDSFYLLDGRIAMRCGEETFLAVPGDYVALPHGVPHTFRVVGEQPARMLQIHGDGSFLDFITSIGTPAPRREVPAGQTGVDFSQMANAAAQTGQPVIGPPMSEAEAEEILAIHTRRLAGTRLNAS